MPEIRRALDSRDAIDCLLHLGKVKLSEREDLVHLNDQLVDIVESVHYMEAEHAALEHDYNLLKTGIQSDSSGINTLFEVEIKNFRINVDETNKTRQALINTQHDLTSQVREAEQQWKYYASAAAGIPKDVDDEFQRLSQIEAENNLTLRRIKYIEDKNRLIKQNQGRIYDEINLMKMRKDQAVSLQHEYVVRKNELLHSIRNLEEDNKAIIMNEHKYFVRDRNADRHTFRDQLRKAIADIRADYELKRQQTEREIHERTRQKIEQYAIGSSQNNANRDRLREELLIVKRSYTDMQKQLSDSEIRNARISQQIESFRLEISENHQTFELGLDFKTKEIEKLREQCTSLSLELEKLCDVNIGLQKEIDEYKRLLDNTTSTTWTRTDIVRPSPIPHHIPQPAVVHVPIPTPSPVVHVPIPTPSPVVHVPIPTPSPVVIPSPTPIYTPYQPAPVVEPTPLPYTPSVFTDRSSTYEHYQKKSESNTIVHDIDHHSPSLPLTPHPTTTSDWIHRPQPIVQPTAVASEIALSNTEVEYRRVYDHHQTHVSNVPAAVDHHHHHQDDHHHHHSDDHHHHHHDDHHHHHHQDHHHHDQHHHHHHQHQSSDATHQYSSSHTHQSHNSFGTIEHSRAQTHEQKLTLDQSGSIGTNIHHHSVIGHGTEIDHTGRYEYNSDVDSIEDDHFQRFTRWYKGRVKIVEVNTDFIQLVNRSGKKNASIGGFKLIHEYGHHSVYVDLPSGLILAPKESLKIYARKATHPTGALVAEINAFDTSVLAHTSIRNTSNEVKSWFTYVSNTEIGDQNQ